jgi:hypothetical protein
MLELRALPIMQKHYNIMIFDRTYRFLLKRFDQTQICKEILNKPPILGICASVMPIQGSTKK